MDTICILNTKTKNQSAVTRLAERKEGRKEGRKKRGREEGLKE